MDSGSEEYPKRSSVNRSANSNNRSQKSLDYSKDNTKTGSSGTKQNNIKDNNNNNNNDFNTSDKDEDNSSKRNDDYEELDRRRDKHYREFINRPLLGEGDDDPNNNDNISTHRSYGNKSHYHQVNKETTATRSTHSDSNNSNDNQDNDSIARQKRQLNNHGREFNAFHEDDTDYLSHKKDEDSVDDYQYDTNYDNNDMNNIDNLNVTYDDINTKQCINLCLHDCSGNCKLLGKNLKLTSVRSRRRNKTHQEEDGTTEEFQGYSDNNISDLQTRENKSISNKTRNSDDFIGSNNWKDKSRDISDGKSASDRNFSRCSESWSIIHKPVLFIRGYLLPSAYKSNMLASNDRYQTFTQSDEDLVKAPHNRFNESQRLTHPNRKYSKLNHHYLTPTKKYTITHELKRLALLVLIVLVSCLMLWKIYEVLLDEYNYLGVVETPSELGKFKHYAVSTDALPCAKVGSSLLAKGGSAVDAAVGTLLCMGVVLPNSLGLGGGCLMTIYDRKKKEATVIDGREVAPDYATENMFANDSLKASRGPLSIGIPGELAAYWKAHQMFGKLNWSELFDESINLAENGSPLVEHLAFALRHNNHSKYITKPLAKLMTNNATGRYYDQGEIFVQKEFANTLKRIRDNGVKEFYGGLTGQLFIQDLKEQGGQITLENLMNYEALVKVPLVINLASDLTMFTQPPPGSGIVLSIILRVMKELGYYKKLKPQSSFESSSLYYHRLVEAFKFAYAQRAGLEDKPDDSNRMKQLMEKLSSDKFITEVAMRIKDKTHDSNYYGGIEYFSDDHGTAHVSVVDAEGNAAAVTSSVNLYFGSGLLSPSTGITYNDVMDDFTSPNLVNKFNLAPSKFNRIRPGKRPLSSMAPSVFTDSEGNVRLVIGGSGGSKITTAIASVSLRNCFLGEDIKTAIDGPRLHHQFLPDKIMYEHNFPKKLLVSLVDRGHSLEKILDRSSVIMAIANNQLNRTEKQITANSDYRKGGSVAGL